MTLTTLYEGETYELKSFDDGKAFALSYKTFGLTILIEGPKATGKMKTWIDRSTMEWVELCECAWDEFASPYFKFLTREQQNKHNLAR